MTAPGRRPSPPDIEKATNRPDTHAMGRSSVAREYARYEADDSPARAAAPVFASPGAMPTCLACLACLRSLAAAWAAQRAALKRLRAEAGATSHAKAKAS